VIHLHQKEMICYRQDSNYAESETEVSNISPFVILDKLVAISLYSDWQLQIRISLSVCGKNHVYTGMEAMLWQ